jgi:hypothetical protein
MRGDAEGVGVGRQTLEAMPTPASVHDKVNNAGGSSSSSSIPWNCHGSMPMYSRSKEQALQQLSDLLSLWSSTVSRGEVAYQLELPESLAGVHDLFHVSQLKKCLRIPEEHIPLEEHTVKENPTYEEYPVKILETTERVTRSQVINTCKVQ